MKKYQIIGVNGSQVAKDPSHPLMKVVKPDFLKSYTVGEMGKSSYKP